MTQLADRIDTRVNKGVRVKIVPMVWLVSFIRVAGTREILYTPGVFMYMYTPEFRKEYVRRDSVSIDARATMTKGLRHPRLLSLGKLATPVVDRCSYKDGKHVYSCCQLHILQRSVS